ncbi:hypothetical protein OCS_06056 [Ophiocordyceps sinensis CO18]|uniref:Uncharacterized protein n=1 Tax=Ophiocordyceps sinensis (strain Co18 / CGMCC 3.14243) TaxID=911162 RepID=T5A8V5_OPHSC|nr:hypothetical protein OCS_06056 [Ophiocordyceps sinensis CO18]
MFPHQKPRQAPTCLPLFSSASYLPLALRESRNNPATESTSPGILSHSRIATAAPPQTRQLHLVDMDVAYNQHADRARHKNRSAININHLSLAPLTVKLPLNDADHVLDSPAHAYTTSYLQGKSAPTTPRLLSRSATPSRSRSHQRVPSAPGIPITKSVSSALADDDATPNGSRFPSRFHSRSHSMAESHSHVGTPLDRPDDGEGSYFPGQDVSIVRPDFVDLDEELEELEFDTAQDDEATVRRLVRRGQAGKGSWISNVIGWSLFSVDEDEENSAEDDDDDEDGHGGAEDTLWEGRTGLSARHFEGVSNAPLERMPPPATDAGGWKDAAWLLSVASKVVF